MREIIRVYDAIAGWCLFKFELDKRPTPNKLHLSWCAAGTDVNDVAIAITLVKNECKIP